MRGSTGVFTRPVLLGVRTPVAADARSDGAHGGRCCRHAASADVSSHFRSVVFPAGRLCHNAGAVRVRFAVPVIAWISGGDNGRNFKFCPYRKPASGKTGAHYVR